MSDSKYNVSTWIEGTFYGAPYMLTLAWGYISENLHSEAWKAIIDIQAKDNIFNDLENILEPKTWKRLRHLKILDSDKFQTTIKHFPQSIIGILGKHSIESRILNDKKANNIPETIKRQKESNAELKGFI